MKTKDNEDKCIKITNICDVTQNLDYGLQTAKERIEYLEDMMYTKEGYPVEFFERLFDQDVKVESIKDKFKRVDLILTSSQDLSCDVYECKQIEKMADYLLFAPDQDRMDKQQTYKFYDSKNFKKLCEKERLYEEISNNMSCEDDNLVSDEIIDIMGSVNPVCRKYHYSEQRVMRSKYIDKEKKFAFLARWEGHLRDDKVKIYKKDFKDPELPLLSQWELDINNLKELKEETRDSRQKRQIENMISELKNVQIVYKKYKKGIFEFISPLNGSTEIDYDEVDMFDKSHVLALLNMPERQISPEDELSLVLYDFKQILDKVEIRDSDLDVVKMYRNGKTMEEIAKRKKIAKQSVSMIMDKLANRIVSEYEEIYEDWYYLNKVKGEYKGCSRCGEIKLTSKFREDLSKIDGRRYNCRRCD